MTFINKDYSKTPNEMTRGWKLKFNAYKFIPVVVVVAAVVVAVVDAGVVVDGFDCYPWIHLVDSVASLWVKGLYCLRITY